MKTVFFTLFALFFIPVKAQDTLQGPHGGKLKRLEYYNMELVECYAYAEVYIYDYDMCPVNNYGLEGKVEFCYEKHKCVSSALYPYGVDGFTASIEDQCYNYSTVIIKLPGENVRTKFSSSCIE